MSHSCMLRFILVLPRARADAGFRLNDLPGSGGRIDILCRSLAACFEWGAEKWPQDRLEIVTIMANRRVIYFRSPQEGQMSERAWAELVAMALEGHTIEGIEVQEGTLGTVLDAVQRRPDSLIWVLDEDASELNALGQALEHAENSFIMGDHNGFDAETRELVELHRLPRISLGSTSYLSSHCIAIVISELERLT